MTGFKTLEERTEEQRRLARLKNLERQDSLFHVDRSSVEILTSLIFNGGAARIGPVAFSTLATIRALVPITGSTGFPSLETLSDLVGVSKPTMRKALVALEREGLLERLRESKKGRTNVYALKEQWIAESTDGSRKVVIEGDYTPALWKQTNAELDKFERTGTLPENTSANLEIRNTPSEKTKSNDEEELEEELMTLLDDPRVRGAFENYLNKFK